jgi:hypothetical protein
VTTVLLRGVVRIEPLTRIPQSGLRLAHLALASPGYAVRRPSFGYAQDRLAGVGQGVGPGGAIGPAQGVVRYQVHLVAVAQELRYAARHRRGRPVPRELGEGSDGVLRYAREFDERGVGGAVHLIQRAHLSCVMRLDARPAHRLTDRPDVDRR